MSDWRKLPRDGKSRNENRVTQPIRTHAVFNNPDVITEGWYPVCPSREIRRGQIRSFSIRSQRFVVFRGDDGNAKALDAFCPHMGADLGRGAVVGNEVQCYFHRWQFSGAGGLTKTHCKGQLPKDVSVPSYPVEEKYGYVWIYSARHAPYSVPSPPGLEDEELEGSHLACVTLFVHHHILMVGAIDLQHFSTVHGLDIEFDYDVSEKTRGVFDWDLSGQLPRQGWKARLGRWLLGDRFGYRARFAGGSVVSINYGPEQRFRGTGRKLPSVQLLWGCVPLESGVSQAHVFVVLKKRKGLVGRLKNLALKALTLALLVILRDDDVKAFPNMRFYPKTLIPADQSAARLMSLLDTLQVSAWSPQPSTSAAGKPAEPYNYGHPEAHA